MSFRQKIDAIKFKIASIATAIVVTIGGVISQLQNCSQSAIITTSQVIKNPSNQAMAMEATSFVANLFYEGTDDPFPTTGVGGEVGRMICKLNKENKSFTLAIRKIIDKTGDIINSARRWDSPQIQAGKRAIQKKQGHAIRDGYQSAFSDIPINQESAEQLINDIIQNAEIIVIRPKQTKVYSQNGQGISISTKNAEFTGFVELLKETEK